jgi:hypothetical protein
MDNRVTAGEDAAEAVGAEEDDLVTELRRFGEVELDAARVGPHGLCDVCYLANGMEISLK